MSNLLINRFVIKRYATLLTKFERSTGQLTSQQVLDLLLVRDAVQGALNGSLFGTAARLEKVRKLDKRLKEQGQVIAGVVELADYRATVCPASDAWWWFFDREKLPSKGRYSWHLDVLTFAFLIISIFFVVDIGLRFLVDRFDLITVLPVFVDVVLAALIGKLVFGDSGGAEIEEKEFNLNQPNYDWQSKKSFFLATAFFLCLTFSFHQYGLPYFASWYHAQIRADLKVGELQRAQTRYKIAISLDPDNILAHYNLGSLSEELFDFDRARAEYRMAILQGFAPAYNNLARLHILEEEYSEAVALLLKGLQVVEYDEVRYDMLKNLAWARIGQGRYAEAMPYLTEALEITEEKAPAHCLLAQVLDAQEKKAEADARWESCLRRASEYNPDEDRWIGMMRNRATKEGNE